MKKLGLIAGCLLLGVLAWHFWPEHPSVEETPKAQEDNIVRLSPQQIEDFGIETKIAGPGELAVTVSTRGKIILHPDKLAHILPKIAGVAKEARKNIGDVVQEGEILAILESREMADIKANYLAAKEKMSLSFNLLEREKRLNVQKISAEQDFINAQSNYEEAKINFQLAEQKLHAYGIEDQELADLSSAHNPELRLFAIRSPMEGTVIARHITKGEFIESAMKIYEIADLTRIWIEIGVYPKDLKKVKEGQLIDIYLSTEEKISQAKIIYLSPIIQEETITTKAIAEVQNSQGDWRPGSFVRVDITTEDVIAKIKTPKEAVQDMEGKPYVFVKVSDGFEKRQAQIGASDSNSCEILSGLNPGDEYACSKTFLLKADLSKKDAEDDDD